MLGSNDLSRQSMEFCLAQTSHEAIGEDSGYEGYANRDSLNVISQNPSG